MAGGSRLRPRPRRPRPRVRSRTLGVAGRRTALDMDGADLPARRRPLGQIRRMPLRPVERPAHDGRSRPGSRAGRRRDCRDAERPANRAGRDDVQADGPFRRHVAPARGALEGGAKRVRGCLDRRRQDLRGARRRHSPGKREDVRRAPDRRTRGWAAAPLHPRRNRAERPLGIRIGGWRVDVDRTPAIRPAAHKFALLRPAARLRQPRPREERPSGGTRHRPPRHDGVSLRGRRRDMAVGAAAGHRAREGVLPRRPATPRRPHRRRLRPRPHRPSSARRT